jgi:hypothetical protein
LAEALLIQEEAEALMSDHEFTVTSVQVLTLLIAAVVLPMIADLSPWQNS